MLHMTQRWKSVEVCNASWSLSNILHNELTQLLITTPSDVTLSLSESVKIHACHRRTVYVVLMIGPKEALWICCVCSPLRSHLPRLYWMTVSCWCEWVCACSYVYVVQGHLGKPPTVPPSHLQSANTSCCPILKKHTTHTLTRLNTLVWSRHD